MQLFGTNQVQLFKFFSGFKKIQSVLPQKKGIEVSSSLKDEILARTIKIDSLEKPTIKLLENMKNLCKKIICLKYSV